ncbi:MAG: Ig-like domain-containing protein, partial [Methylococcaceae bacterium]|nr:Ig-like domain-containing protein [Methylococcaceae bacterium]
MKRNSRVHVLLACSLLLTVLVAGSPGRAANSALLGWNNLGMHCMDSDYSVFSILPAYNTIEAQLIVNGRLVKSGTGYTVTYQAVADPAGSFNSTSIGKGNFYTYVAALYGANLAPDMGLAGWAMPGTNNVARTMQFEATNSSVRVNWFRAEGIPLTPYDNAGRKNTYPLMRLVAKDSAGNVLGASPIVLPVSDEMDCRACHASGSASAAQPAAGWVNDSNPERDYRLNILRLHDENRDPATWAGILSATGFNPRGLYAGVVNDQHPVLCARCHLSEALPGTGHGSISPLTRAVHSRHAAVRDPVLAATLDDAANRAACYRCHPGSATKCLRGAMGTAVASDGTMAMQCQSCHGNMSQVGSASRVGWVIEPNCQSCHTGTATHNNGQLRYTSVFTSDGAVRAAVDQTFATTPNTPATGLSLFRFSSGHGGLQCEACHGSTHAEFPSSHSNDNLRNVQLQGHAGVLAECTACHVTMPVTVNGGPHGMHPTGQAWVNQHGGLVEHGGASRSQCQACHGLDYRGTVLSRAQGQRSFVASAENGTTSVQLFRGAFVGCYTCHNGPSSESINSNPAPSVSDVSGQASVGRPVSLTLGGGNLTYQIISRPAHGTVGLLNGVATYFPEAGFSGTDTFTYAVYNGAKNSRVATVTIQVGAASDASAPALVVVSPANGSTVITRTITVSGTASDNGRGGHGIRSVTVNGQVASGGTAAGSGTASWTASVPLMPGQNSIVIVARDGYDNAATRQLDILCNWSTNRWTVWWQHDNGTLASWTMSGAEPIRSGRLNPSSPGTGWRVMSTGDLYGRGESDLILQRSDGLLGVWCMEGTNCSSTSRLNPARLGPGWKVKATGDLGGDGLADLLL